MASVRLAGIAKQFGDKPVLEGIDLDIADGEFVVLAGPRGCGKSTLLRIIAGLEQPGAGSVEIGGRAGENGIAMVFQDDALYPHMTAAANMGFALKLAGVPREERAERVARAAAILQIGGLLERRPGELSDAGRQRVAIGRAIVREAAVFLFDEPLSRLDAALRAQTRIALARLHRETGATMVHATCDQAEAMALGGKIVVLDGGRIEQAGTPLDLYERPANLFVASFLGSPRMNFLPATLAGEEGRSAHLRLAGGALLHAAVDASQAPPGGAVTLGVRPEHLRVVEREGGDGAAGFAATVELVEYLGDASIVHARVDGVAGLVSLKCRAEETCPEAGERVMLGCDPEHAHVFDAAGVALPRAAGFAPALGAPRRREFG